MSQTPNRLANLRSLKAATADASFANAFGTLVGGPFLVKLLGILQANDAWLGVFTAIGPLTGLVQIPAAIWGRRYTTYKNFVFPGGLLWRLLYAPLICVAFMPLSNEAKLWFLLVLITTASICVQIVTPIYNDWLAELIPAGSRGWYFSRRNMIMGVVGAAAALIGGFVIDAFEKNGNLAMGVSAVFGMGFAAAMVSQYYFGHMTDLVRENPLEVSIAAGTRAMLAPFRDKAFRPVLLFFSVFVLANGFAGNFFSKYAFETLHMNVATLQITAVSSAIGQILSIRFWGLLSDKYGNKPVLMILGAGITLTPLQWMFLKPDQLWMNLAILGFFHIFVGVFWGGIGVCQFNLLLSTSREEDRANYLGAGQALQSIIGGLSPLLGGLLMEQFRMSLGSAVQAYFLLFTVTMVLRVFALFFLIPVKEKGSTSISGTLRDLSKVTPIGVRALQQMRTSPTDLSRQSAIAQAAGANFEIARDDIINALHDPSPRVRREAAAALSVLRSPAASEALIHMLRDHPDLVDEEIFDALGRLGDTRSIKEIIPFLSSPSPAVRRAAARSLGSLNSPESLAALRRGAEQKDDPDLRRAALQGLRELGAREAVMEVADALLDPLPSVRIAAAEAAVHLELNQAAPTLRESLVRYQDEASSEVAYALGALGSNSDLGAILIEAQRTRSNITRRRCLLGAARLMDVESSVYRLFLLEEMSLDNFLLQELAPKLRKHPEINQALSLFSSEREFEALQMLAEHSEDARFEVFADHPVKDAFLIAVCAFAHDSS